MIQSDASVAPDGTVRYIRRMDVFTVAPLDMTHFPFDEHEVHIFMDSFAYDASQILLVPSNASKHFDPTHLANALYDVHSWKIMSSVQPSLLSPRDSVIDAHFVASRKPAGIFVEIIIPLAIISVFALSAGYVGMEHLDVRIGIASTAMLTVMAYLYVVNDKLPDIAYMCWIHYYTAMCFLFVFLVLIEIVLIHYMDPKASSGQSEKDERFARIQAEDPWAYYRVRRATPPPLAPRLSLRSFTPSSQLLPLIPSSRPLPWAPARRCRWLRS